jgi:hypothetical protein
MGSQRLKTEAEILSALYDEEPLSDEELDDGELYYVRFVSYFMQFSWF